MNLLNSTAAFDLLYHICIPFFLFLVNFQVSFFFLSSGFMFHHSIRIWTVFAIPLQKSIGFVINLVSIALFIKPLAVKLKFH